MARGSLGFGIVRSVDQALGRARLAEMCTVLTDEIGVLFVPHHPGTYRNLIDAFGRGEVGLAWLPPIAGLALEEAGSATVLALPTRRGSLTYGSAIFTRPDGPRTMQDLKGCKMAWVDPDSSSGYLVPRLCLQGAGMNLATMFAQESFLLSHAAVVEGVLAGRFDAGATYFQPLGPDKKVRGSWGDASVRVVATSGSIPNDAIVATRAMAPETRAKVVRWLLDLRTDRAKSLCRDLFGADAFRVAAGEHFEPLRRMLIAARTHGSIPPPPRS